MKKLIDNNPVINILESEYKRLLGFPSNYTLEGRVCELAEWAKHWYALNGHPWIYAYEADELYLSSDKLLIDNIEFSSQKFREQLSEAGAFSAMVVIVSAGKECEEKAQQLWQEGKPDKYFFLEIYGSAVVEYLITSTGATFCAWADESGYAILPHYSPGYPGWNAEDQFPLYQLIKHKSGNNLPGDIKILQSGMLNPKKSMLAVFGITKETARVKNLRELIPCENCSLEACNYRRVPFKYSRAQIEDVSRMQPVANNIPYEAQNRHTTLNLNANYKVNPKTLQKWANERLKIHFLEDESVEAGFKYEGTTCSNMGHKLEFDYTIKLSPSSEGYRIIELNCRPAADDNGHTYMCEYLQDSETLMSNIENEKPLLNKNLNEILEWKRPFNPEGCYCNSDSREHKWGLVLEVLHYKLAQIENKN
jgi:hypothetical protein